MRAADVLGCVSAFLTDKFGYGESSLFDFMEDIKRGGDCYYVEINRRTTIPTRQEYQRYKRLYITFGNAKETAALSDEATRGEPDVTEKSFSTDAELTNQLRGWF